MRLGLLPFLKKTLLTKTLEFCQAKAKLSPCLVAH